MHVFPLWHTRVTDDGTEDDKLLGIYSTREKAEERIASAVHLPGFRDHADGFEVVEYEVDKDEWTEGFGIPWPPE